MLSAENTDTSFGFRICFSVGKKTAFFRFQIQISSDFFITQSNKTLNVMTTLSTVTVQPLTLHQGSPTCFPWALGSTDGRHELLTGLF